MVYLEVKMIDNNLEQYLVVFKTKPLKEKQAIIIEQLKMLAAFCQNMCNKVNINNEVIISKELIDLNKDDYTEDDFAEAIIVLVNSIQNSLSDFSIKLTDIMEYITNK